MADPICRWRNPYVNTIIELVKVLPHEAMPSDEFRAIVEKRWPDFFHTPYQLACQAGLYYESEDGQYYPRFDHDIDEAEALSYMKKWITRYYVPNPYTRSMRSLQQPQPFLASIIGYIYEHPDEKRLHAILEAVFQERIGNIDIISNVLNTYTDLIKVDAFGNVELTVKAIDFMKQYIDRNDKKAFFDIFSESKRTVDDTISKNLIFYGAPGTGKSNTIKRIVDDQNKINYRVTFHPDSDYSTFVGAYKPAMKTPEKEYSPEELVAKLKETKLSGVSYPCHKFSAQYWKSVKKLSAEQIKQMLLACGFTESMIVEISKGVAVGEELFNRTNEEQIVYRFVPQAFAKAYTAAWKTTDEVFLIIEEINRGNCAQIFGDLFQLLDRKEGFSEYPVDADSDLADFIRRELANSPREDFPEGVKEGNKLVLPSNLYIWATMNTSDQSLFPIDSAFKRRWDWQYLPITDGKKNWKIEAAGNRYDWWQFLEKINEQIGSTTNSEDKKLGYYFCKANNGIIKADTFVSKVVFYLWNDVFKDFAEEAGGLFDDTDGKILSFNKFYTAGADGRAIVKEEKVALLLQNLGVDVLPIIEGDEPDNGDERIDEQFTVILNGEAINGKPTDVFVKTLQAVGLERLVDKTIDGCVLVTTEKPVGAKSRQFGGYFVNTGLWPTYKRRWLETMAREMNIDLKIE